MHCSRFIQHFFMNLILLDKEDFINSDRVRLHGRRFEHAREVLNVSNGKILRVGLINGRTGVGTVHAVGECSLELDVILAEAPPAPLPATIILALPRPKVLKRVLQSLAALGIKRIILINTWRVDKSYWQSPALAPASLREQLLLGLEQGRDTLLPTVEMRRRFKPFAQDSLPSIAEGTCALLAHPSSPQPCPFNIDRALTLAVGPEGGFTDYEVDLMTAAGLTPIHLGTRPLRVETAIPALIGRLMHCC